jgi:hypothetical protein
MIHHGYCLLFHYMDMYHIWYNMFIDVSLPPIALYHICYSPAVERQNHSLKKYVEICVLCHIWYRMQWRVKVFALPIPQIPLKHCYCYLHAFLRTPPVQFQWWLLTIIDTLTDMDVSHSNNALFTISSWLHCLPVKQTEFLNYQDGRYEINNVGRLIDFAVWPKFSPYLL